MVRDFTKWDDTPVSLQHFAQSVVRAYKIAMTPPHEPVMISLDAGLQDVPVESDPHLYIPNYVASAPPQAEMGALREAAKMLVNAEHPVIVAERMVAHRARHQASGGAGRAAAGAGGRTGPDG